MVKVLLAGGRRSAAGFINSALVLMKRRFQTMRSCMPKIREKIVRLLGGHGSWRQR